MADKIEEATAKSFIKNIEQYAEFCVELIKKYHKAKTKVGKRLKAYHESVNVLKKELSPKNTDRVFPKTASNVKAFRSILEKLKDIIPKMVDEGDYDDAWMWYRSSELRATYSKGDQEVKKITLYISKIYRSTTRVTDRYKFMVFLFIVLHGVCSNKATRDRLKVIVEKYTEKLESIPEEERLIEDESEGEEDKGQGDLKGTIDDVLSSALSPERLRALTGSAGPPQEESASSEEEGGDNSEESEKKNK